MQPSRSIRTCLLLISVGALTQVTWPARGADLTWTNTAGGNWSVAANWSPNQVPTAADNVAITNSGNYTVTLDANSTVTGFTLGGTNGTQMFSASGRTLTLNGANTINSAGFLQLNNSTVSGAGSLACRGTVQMDSSAINAGLVNQGLLRVGGGNSSLGGGFENRAGATLRVFGPNLATTQLTVSSGFTNGGVIELTGEGGLAGDSRLMVSSGVLVNEVGGLIRALPSPNAIERTLGAQLDNRGTVSAQMNLVVNKSGAAHLNSGTIQLTGGGMTVQQSGSPASFTTTGTIDIGTNRTFTVNGGTFHYNSGTLGGLGTLTLKSLTASLLPDLNTGTMDVQLDAATVNGPGWITNAAGNTMSALNSSAINAGLVNQGLLRVGGGNSSLGGGFENRAGATLRVFGQNVATTQLTASSGFTNEGVIELSGEGGQAGDSWLVVSSGVLVNEVGGLILALPSPNAGARTLNAQLDNRGLVLAQMNLVVNKSGAAHLNSGTIQLTGGGMTVQQSGSPASFTTTGTIDIGTNRTFTVNGGTFLNHAGGTIRGLGTLSTAKTSFINDAVVSPGTSAGILTCAGPFPQSTNGVLRVEIGGPVAGTDYDQFRITGNATLGGTMDVQLINGFQPVQGDRFEVVRFSSHNGFFDHITGLSIGGGNYLQPIFSTTNLVLEIIDTLPGLTFTAPQAMPSGQIQFTLGGTAEQDFTIEATTNLTAPIWVTVHTLTNAGAFFTFIVTDATNFPIRFFRAKQ